jgi:hypothetical protein
MKFPAGRAGEGEMRAANAFSAGKKRGKCVYALLIYALKSKLFNAGSSAEKRGFRPTHAASRRIVLTADVY